MPRKGDVHVVQGDKGGWDVKVEGTSGARSHHRTQDNASGAGRKVAKSNKSELLIHGRDGKIRERNTYRGDPYPPKG